MNTIVVSHPLYSPGMALLKSNDVQVIIPNNGNSDDILADLQKADGFILRIGKIDRKAIEACPNLKVITRPGVGVDNVDVKAATEHGIPVVVCPAANTKSVAEHTMAMLFAVAKNLIESVHETKKGNFNIRNKYSAIEISGKTLVILGFGNIGHEVAKIASAIGMKIVVFDPYVTEGDVKNLGYTYTDSLLAAVPEGDFISLHMPSSPTTKGMIDETIFLAMKPNAYFINCARGDIVDEKALYQALKNRQIAGAAVDVMTSEPMDQNSPLLKLSNFIATPHMAGQTQEATTKIVSLAVEGTLAVLRGENWPHVCNPEVYETPKWKEM